LKKVIIDTGPLMKEKGYYLSDALIDYLRA